MEREVLSITLKDSMPNVSLIILSDRTGEDDIEKVVGRLWYGSRRGRPKARLQDEVDKYMNTMV